MEFTDEDYKEIIYQSRSSYIKEMVDLLGMDSTLKFVRLFEGQTVTIPRFTNRNTSNKIKSLLGEKIARTLSFTLANVEYMFYLCLRPPTRQVFKKK